MYRLVSMILVMLMLFTLASTITLAQEKISLRVAWWGS